MNTNPSQTYPNMDAGVYTLLSTAIWIVLVVILLIAFRKVIRSLIVAITKRLEGGALVKIWNIELGPLRVSENSLPESRLIKARIDRSLEVEREDIYKLNKRLFLVHRLFPSSLEGQLYDILIYVKPHKGTYGSGNLDDVIQVDYYFGATWGHNVFSSTDRVKRFAVVASSHGSGFLCFARVHLRSGDNFTTWRYIDFEMGGLGE